MVITNQVRVVKLSTVSGTTSTANYGKFRVMGGTLGYDVDMVYPISLSAGYEKVSNGQGVFRFDKRVSLGANAQLNDNTSFGLNYTNLKNDNKNIRLGAQVKLVGTDAFTNAYLSQDIMTLVVVVTVLLTQVHLISLRSVKLWLRLDLASNFIHSIKLSKLDEKRVLRDSFFMLVKSLTYVAVKKYLKGNSVLNVKSSWSNDLVSYKKLQRFFVCHK